MRSIRNLYWNFGFFQKHQKCSYFDNFSRMWLANELFFTFSASTKYDIAEINLIILLRVTEYTTYYYYYYDRQTDRQMNRQKDSGVPKT